MRDKDFVLLGDLYEGLVLCEGEQKNSLTLYRGDSSDIKMHSLDKGDVGALFGHGIYLTSNKRIAGDYKLKGSGDKIFSASGYKNKDDVIEAYIRREAKFIDKDGNSTGFYEMPLPSFEDDPERLKRLEFARKKWEEIKNQHEVRMNVDGTSAIVKKQSGNISVYEIPMEIINKTYNVEGEINQNAIDSLCSAIFQRDRSCRILNDIIVKDEDGFLPTFRVVWNELRNRKYLLDKESQIKFRQAMKTNGGYKGLEYAGGITMGGGIHHRAFVLWDEQGISKYRVK